MVRRTSVKDKNAEVLYDYKNDALETKILLPKSLKKWQNLNKHLKTKVSPKG